jgi:hypothetical protein
MGEFFKRCGIGILVIVASPLWAAYYLLYVVYCLLLLVFAPLRFLVSLFTKDKMTIKSDYDRKAEAILKGSPAQADGMINNPQAPIPGYMFSNSPTTSFTAGQAQAAANNFSNQQPQPSFQPYQAQPTYPSSQTYYPNQQPAYQQPSYPPQPNYSQNGYQQNGYQQPANVQPAYQPDPSQMQPQPNYQPQPQPYPQANNNYLDSNNPQTPNGSGSTNGGN